MGTVDLRRPRFRPPQFRLARDRNARRLVNRLDNPVQLRRPEGSLELHEAGREIDDSKCAGRRLKRGLQYVSAWQVALRSGLAAGRSDSKSASVLPIEQCSS